MKKTNFGVWAVYTALATLVAVLTWVVIEMVAICEFSKTLRTKE